MKKLMAVRGVKQFYFVRFKNCSKLFSKSVMVYVGKEITNVEKSKQNRMRKREQSRNVLLNEHTERSHLLHTHKDKDSFFGKLD